MEKKCTKCGEVKKSSEFYTYSKICKYCTKKYQDKHYKKILKERLSQKIKSSKEYPEKCMWFKKGFYVKNGKVFKSEELKKNDKLRNLKNKTRQHINQNFKRYLKADKNIKPKYSEILGCDINLFVIYISSKLKKGMTLENYGEWHLDHIVPLAFDDNEKSVLILSHYTNFQPLWAKENILKNSEVSKDNIINLKNNPRFKLSYFSDLKKYFLSYPIVALCSIFLSNASCVLIVLPTT